MAAVDEIGMGHANKLLLKFSDYWWPEFDYIHSDTEVRLWWRCAPGVCGLVGFSGGPAALALAELGDNAVELALRHLGSTFGSVVFDTFESGRVANWSDDPLSFGAYSYDAVLQPTDARSRLAAPVGKGMYFAGEATCTNGRPGTVDGALKSGIRAAREVLESF
jgi:monoamine oxidase